MNNVFNLRRFLLLFRKTVVERPLQTVGITLLLLVLSAIMYTFIKTVVGLPPAQNLTFIWGLAGGAFFLASFVFNYFSSNATGSSYLTLPVSWFEKWLCAVLIVGVFYPLIFILFFHGLDLAFVAAAHQKLDPTSPFYKEQYDSIYTFNLTSFVAWRVYELFLFFTGAMLLGSLYFNKIPLVKTAIAICVCLVALVGINWIIARLMFPKLDDTGPFDHVSVIVGKETGKLLLPEKLELSIHSILAYWLPSVLWLLPLIRLREKEF